VKLVSVILILILLLRLRLRLMSFFVNEEIISRKMKRAIKMEMEKEIKSMSFGLF
jgi:hypothetical protein